MNSLESTWKNRVGEVSTLTSKVVVVDISVDPTAIEYDATAEYIVRLNGKVVKRMNAWQAIRMGIAMEGYGA
jgi:hypothetical protein